MNRLRLRNSGRLDRSKDTTPLDSDRESLHFPAGGVFGVPVPPSSPRSPSTNTINSVRDIERTLDRMQSQLDEISTEVEQVFHLPNDPRDWTPPAAA